MKLLCLHGAYGNADNFRTQLTPFLNAVGGLENLEFKWINGGHGVTPPEGFESYFGSTQLYRFIDFDGLAALDDVLFKIREMPEGESAEESIRKLAVGSTWSSKNITTTLDRLFQIIDEDPDIDGILGYSEGATVAATLVLEEQRRVREEGRKRRMKLGIFFSGWPPVTINGDHVRCVLADEQEDLIDIPTLHIVGSKDPYIHGAVALFNICDPDTAILFDHGRGHTLPRDERTVTELSSAVDGALNLATQCVS